MIKTTRVIWCVAVLGVAQCLNELPNKVRRPPSDGPRTLRRLLESLANTKYYLTNGGRKTINPVELAKAKSMFDAVQKSAIGKHNILRSPDTDNQKIEDLRQNVGLNEERQEMIETELQDTISKHTSALLHNAYLEKRGRNDFLVFEDAAKDPFVTVVPNNIYYNAEKKCVNWLDDCTLQGIRARLLQKVNSPYK